MPPLRGLPVKVIVRRDYSSIFSAYNSIIDEALQVDDFAGLVLMHDDVEIRDEKMIEKVKTALPEADVIGVIGGIGLRRSMDWAAADKRFGWAEDERKSHDYGPPPPGGVDSVDGIFLALSPRACRELRFDEEHFSGFHGYDADICAQAKAKGMIVDLVQVNLYHHKNSALTDMRAWNLADAVWMLKWRASISFVRRWSYRTRVAWFAPRLW